MCTLMAGLVCMFYLLFFILDLNVHVIATNLSHVDLFLIHIIWDDFVPKKLIWTKSCKFDRSLSFTMTNMIGVTSHASRSINLTIFLSFSQ